MEKTTEYDIVLKAATGLITQLTMTVGALAAGTISLEDFWISYAEAIDSFVPESKPDVAQPPASSGEAPPPPDTVTT